MPIESEAEALIHDSFVDHLDRAHRREFAKRNRAERSRRRWLWMYALCVVGSALCVLFGPHNWVLVCSLIVLPLSVINWYATQHRWAGFGA